MGPKILKHSQFCTAELSNSDASRTELRKHQTEVRTLKPATTAKPESKTRRNIVIAIFIAVLVVGVLGYGAYQATKPSITTPTATTETAKLREVLVGQTSIPLDEHGIQLKYESVKGKFRPLGESVKVVIKVIPTLKTRNYAIRISSYSVVVVSMAPTSYLVPVGAATGSDEYWKFEDGTYVKELFINFKKEANVDYFCGLRTFHLVFEGLDTEGHVADLEILVYDLQPP